MKFLLFLFRFRYIDLAMRNVSSMEFSDSCEFRRRYRGTGVVFFLPLTFFLRHIPLLQIYISSHSFFEFNIDNIICCVPYETCRPDTNVLRISGTRLGPLVPIHDRVILLFTFVNHRRVRIMTILSVKHIDLPKTNQDCSLDHVF